MKSDALASVHHHKVHALIRAAPHACGYRTVGSFHPETPAFCRCAWESLQSATGWHMGCMLWPALHWAIVPTHWSIWRTSSNLFCLF